MCFPRVLNSWHIQVIIRWLSIVIWNDVFLIIMIIWIWSSIVIRLIIIIQRIFRFITTQHVIIIIWWNITMLIWMYWIVIIWWCASLSRRIYNSPFDSTSHLT